MKTIVKSYFNQSTSLIKSIILYFSLSSFIIVFSLCLSLIMYLIFYYLYMPNDGYKYSIHWILGTFANQKWVSFPSANLTLDKPFLAWNMPSMTPEHSYVITLELELPDSDVNRNLGMFMCNIKMYSAQGELVDEANRFLTLKYRSSVIRNIRTLLFAPFYIFSWKDEKIVTKLTLFENYINYRFNPAIMASITIENEQIQIYKSTLKIYARYTGLRYFIHEWPIATALYIIIVNAFTLSTFLMCLFLALAYARRKRPFAQPSMLDNNNTSIDEKHYEQKKVVNEPLSHHLKRSVSLKNEVELDPTADSTNNLVDQYKEASLSLRNVYPAIAKTNGFINSSENKKPLVRFMIPTSDEDEFYLAAAPPNNNFSNILEKSTQFSIQPSNDESVNNSPGLRKRLNTCLNSKEQTDEPGCLDFESTFTKLDHPQYPQTIAKKEPQNHMPLGYKTLDDYLKKLVTQYEDYHADGEKLPSKHRPLLPLGELPVHNVTLTPPPHRGRVTIPQNPRSSREKYMAWLAHRFATQRNSTQSNTTKNSSHSLIQNVKVLNSKNFYGHGSEIAPTNQTTYINNIGQEQRLCEKNRCYSVPEGMDFNLYDGFVGAFYDLDYLG